MSDTAPINLPRPAYGMAISLSFYVLLIAVSLIQVFGIFRGVSSATGTVGVVSPTCSSHI